MKYNEIENINGEDTEPNDIPKFKKHIWNAVTILNVQIQGLKDSYSERRDPPRTNVERISCMKG